MRHPSTGPVVYTNTVQRRNEVWAGPRFEAGSFIQIQYLHYMVHGTETEYSSEMAIESDGSKFGTNNETMDLIGMSRNLYNKEITSSFRSRNLVSRVGSRNS